MSRAQRRRAKTEPSRESVIKHIERMTMNNLDWALVDVIKGVREYYAAQ